MAEVADRPASRRRQARIMRVVNVPMRILLSLPVRTPLGGQLMLIYYTGRKTGRSYRQPLSYVRDGQTLLTPGGGRWTLNLTDGQSVRIRLKGRDLLARPELVADPAEIDRLLALMARANPRVDSFVRIPRGPEGHLDRAMLQAAIDHGFRIVRWHPDPLQRSSSPQAG